jgi:hypothetical protein
MRHCEERSNLCACKSGSDILLNNVLQVIRGPLNVSYVAMASFLAMTFSFKTDSDSRRALVCLNAYRHYR